MKKQLYRIVSLVLAAALAADPVFAQGLRAGFPDAPSINHSFTSQITFTNQALSPAALAMIAEFESAQAAKINEIENEVKVVTPLTDYVEISQSGSPVEYSSSLPKQVLKDIWGGAFLLAELRDLLFFGEENPVNWIVAVESLGDALVDYRHRTAKQDRHVRHVYVLDRELVQDVIDGKAGALEKAQNALAGLMLLSFDDNYTLLLSSLSKSKSAKLLEKLQSVLPLEVEVARELLRRHEREKESNHKVVLEPELAVPVKESPQPPSTEQIDNLMRNLQAPEAVLSSPLSSRKSLRPFLASVVIGLVLTTVGLLGYRGHKQSNPAENPAQSSQKKEENKAGEPAKPVKVTPLTPPVAAPPPIAIEPAPAPNIPPVVHQVPQEQNLSNSQSTPEPAQTIPVTPKRGENENKPLLPRTHERAVSAVSTAKALLEDDTFKQRLLAIEAAAQAHPEATDKTAEALKLQLEIAQRLFTSQAAIHQAAQSDEQTAIMQNFIATANFLQGQLSNIQQTAGSLPTGAAWLQFKELSNFIDKFNAAAREIRNSRVAITTGGLRKTFLTKAGLWALLVIPFTGIARGAASVSQTVTSAMHHLSTTVPLSIQVNAGEGPYQVAQRLLGDGSRWKELFQYFPQWGTPDRFMLHPGIYQGIFKTIQAAPSVPAVDMHFAPFTLYQNFLLHYEWMIVAGLIAAGLFMLWNLSQIFLKTARGYRWRRAAASLVLYTMMGTPLVNAADKAVSGDNPFADGDSVTFSRTVTLLQIFGEIAKRREELKNQTGKVQEKRDKVDERKTGITFDLGGNYIVEPGITQGGGPNGTLTFPTAHDPKKAANDRESKLAQIRQDEQDEKEASEERAAMLKASIRMMQAQLQIISIEKSLPSIPDTADNKDKRAKLSSDLAKAQAQLQEAFAVIRENARLTDTGTEISGQDLSLNSMQNLLNSANRIDPGAFLSAMGIADAIEKTYGLSELTFRSPLSKVWPKKMQAGYNINATRITMPTAALGWIALLQPLWDNDSPFPGHYDKIDWDAATYYIENSIAKFNDSRTATLDTILKAVAERRDALTLKEKALAAAETHRAAAAANSEDSAAHLERAAELESEAAASEAKAAEQSVLLLYFEVQPDQILEWDKTPSEAVAKEAKTYVDDELFKKALEPFHDLRTHFAEFVNKHIKGKNAEKAKTLLARIDELIDKSATPNPQEPAESIPGHLGFGMDAANVGATNSNIPTVAPYAVGIEENDATGGIYGHISPRFGTGARKKALKAVNEQKKVLDAATAEVDANKSLLDAAIAAQSDNHFLADIIKTIRDAIAVLGPSGSSEELWKTVQRAELELNLIRAQTQARKVSETAASAKALPPSGDLSTLPPGFKAEVLWNLLQAQYQAGLLADKLTDKQVHEIVFSFWTQQSSANSYHPISPSLMDFIKLLKSHMGKKPSHSALERFMLEAEQIFRQVQMDKESADQSVQNAKELVDLYTKAVSLMEEDKKPENTGPMAILRAQLLDAQRALRTAQITAHAAGLVFENLNEHLETNSQEALHVAWKAAQKAVETSTSVRLREMDVRDARGQKIWKVMFGFPGGPFTAYSANNQLFTGQFDPEKVTTNQTWGGQGGISYSWDAQQAARKDKADKVAQAEAALETAKSQSASEAQEAAAIKGVYEALSKTKKDIGPDASPAAAALLVAAIKQSQEDFSKHAATGGISPQSVSAFDPTQPAKTVRWRDIHAAARALGPVSTVEARQLANTTRGITALGFWQRNVDGTGNPQVGTQVTGNIFHIVFKKFGFGKAKKELKVEEKKLTEMRTEDRKKLRIGQLEILEDLTRVHQEEVSDAQKSVEEAQARWNQLVQTKRPTPDPEWEAVMHRWVMSLQTYYQARLDLERDVQRHEELAKLSQNHADVDLDVRPMSALETVRFSKAPPVPAQPPLSDLALLARDVTGSTADESVLKQLSAFLTDMGALVPPGQWKKLVSIANTVGFKPKANTRPAKVDNLIAELKEAVAFVQLERQGANIKLTPAQALALLAGDGNPDAKRYFERAMRDMNSYAPVIEEWTKKGIFGVRDGVAMWRNWARIIEATSNNLSDSMRWMTTIVNSKEFNSLSVSATLSDARVQPFDLLKTLVVQISQYKWSADAPTQDEMDIYLKVANILTIRTSLSPTSNDILSGPQLVIVAGKAFDMSINMIDDLNEKLRRPMTLRELSLRFIAADKTRIRIVNLPFNQWPKKLELTAKALLDRALSLPKESVAGLHTSSASTEQTAHPPAPKPAAPIKPPPVTAPSPHQEAAAVKPPVEKSKALPPRTFVAPPPEPVKEKKPPVETSVVTIISPAVPLTSNPKPPSVPVAPTKPPVPAPPVAASPAKMDADVAAQEMISKILIDRVLVGSHLSEQEQQQVKDGALEWAKGILPTLQRRRHDKNLTWSQAAGLIKSAHEATKLGIENSRQSYPHWHDLLIYFEGQLESTAVTSSKIGAGATPDANRKRKGIATGQASVAMTILTGLLFSAIGWSGPVHGPAAQITQSLPPLQIFLITGALGLIIATSLYLISQDKPTISASRLPIAFQQFDIAIEKVRENPEDPTPLDNAIEGVRNYIQRTYPGQNSKKVSLNNVKSEDLFELLGSNVYLLQRYHEGLLNVFSDYPEDTNMQINRMLSIRKQLHAGIEPGRENIQQVKRYANAAQMKGIAQLFLFGEPQNSRSREVGLAILETIAGRNPRMVNRHYIRRYLKELHDENILSTDEWKRLYGQTQSPLFRWLAAKSSLQNSQSQEVTSPQLLHAA